MQPTVPTNPCNHRPPTASSAPQSRSCPQHQWRQPRQQLAAASQHAWSMLLLLLTATGQHAWEMLLLLQAMAGTTLLLAARMVDSRYGHHPRSSSSSSTTCRQPRPHQASKQQQPLCAVSWLQAQPPWQQQQQQLSLMCQLAPRGQHRATLQTQRRPSSLGLRGTAAARPWLQEQLPMLLQQAQRCCRCSRHQLT